MKDKIKFCPQCNSCLFDDMMSCCVCGYQFTQQDDDLVPLSAYGDFDAQEDEALEPVSQTTDCTNKNLVGSNLGKPVSLSLDCGGCVVDIAVRPKE